MWKIAKFIIFLYIGSSVAHAKRSHLDILRSYYPHGLIGDDYGILSIEDLAVNTCRPSKVEAFVEGGNMTYSYWQCFSLSDAKMKCDSLGYDSVEKKETAHLEIEAHHAHWLHSYLARDAMPMRDCKEYLQDWKQKTKGEMHVCVSGSYGRLGEIKSGQKEMNWIFDKFKTRKGCGSHRSECSMKEVSKDIKKNCIAPKI